jgi:hypothetical protein
LLKHKCNTPRAKKTGAIRATSLRQMEPIDPERKASAASGIRDHTNSRRVERDRADCWSSGAAPDNAGRNVRL